MSTRRGRLRLAIGLAAAVLSQSAALAGPWAEPGETVLRHDIEYLTDAGVLNVPMMTWPMSWGDVARAADKARLADDAPHSVSLALNRVRARARAETAPGYAQFEYGLAASAEPRRLRSFEHTPRENGELNGAIGYTGSRLSGRAEVTVVASPEDDREIRFDGSYLSWIWGNTTFTVGWQEKWWGPGWDGALALSTNARPVPAFAVKRNFTDPFETRWLSWAGPWTATFFIGEMESGRGVPNTKLVGGRVAFRPMRTLELGLIRTAQWGGDGRPESLDSFIDLLLGRDNVGDDDISRDNEPGNQLAGFDWRYRVVGGVRPIAIYGQLIGEDEAGGFPSRYLGQFGVSMSAPVGKDGSVLHARAEYSDTTCQFYESSKRFDCAYSNSLYPSGYRYRGRAIGHSTDGDSRQLALGASLVEPDGRRYSAELRYAEINRGGSPDAEHSLSAIPSDLINFELTYEASLFNGRASFGVGGDFADSDPGGLDGTDLRLFAQWRRQL